MLAKTILGLAIGTAIAVGATGLRVASNVEHQVTVETSLLNFGRMNGNTCRAHVAVHNASQTPIHHLILAIYRGSSSGDLPEKDTVDTTRINPQQTIVVEAHFHDRELCEVSDGYAVSVEAAANDVGNATNVVVKTITPAHDGSNFYLGSVPNNVEKAIRSDRLNSCAEHYDALVVASYEKIVHEYVRDFDFDFAPDHEFKRSLFPPSASESDVLIREMLDESFEEFK